MIIDSFEFVMLLVGIILVFVLNVHFFLFLKSKKQATGNAEAATEKKKLPEKVPDNKDAELSVTLLKIQIGLIRKASKHPSADR